MFEPVTTLTDPLVTNWECQTTTYKAGSVTHSFDGLEYEDENEEVELKVISKTCTVGGIEDTLLMPEEDAEDSEEENEMIQCPPQ